MYQYNKNVLVMYLHSSTSITDCHMKRIFIMDYVKHKSGADTLNENCQEFNCLRKANRRPIVINFNLINVATNNAYIIRNPGKSGKKINFFNQLSFQLAQPYVRNRKLTGEFELLAKKTGFYRCNFKHLKSHNSRNQARMMLQKWKVYSIRMDQYCLGC